MLNVFTFTVQFGLAIIFSRYRILFNQRDRTDDQKEAKMFSQTFFFEGGKE